MAFGSGPKRFLSLHQIAMSVLNLLVKTDDESRQTAEVWVDGELEGTPCQFLLDTGCASTTLTSNAFTRGLKPVGHRSSSGTFGRAKYDLVNVSSISAGPISRKDLTISRAPEGGTDRNLLGMDILRDYRLSFDFDKNQLSIGADSSTDAELEYNEILMDRGLIPYVQVEADGRRGNAVWDSGAGITLVDRSFVQKNPELFVPIGNEIGTDSTNTQRETPIFMMKALKVAARIFHTVKVAAVELRPHDSHVEIPMDFVLGYSVLRQANWVFDFPKRKWTIRKMLL
jgi:hypothetical protein